MTGCVAQQLTKACNDTQCGRARALQHAATRHVDHYSEPIFAFSVIHTRVNVAAKFKNAKPHDVKFYGYPCRIVLPKN